MHRRLMGTSNPPRIFRFESFELFEREGELRSARGRIPLQEQPVQVLIALLENAGNLVTREELQQKIWPGDTFVDFDVGLNTAIRKIRKSLGDDADAPRYIQTLARRGYRWIAPVTLAAAPVAAVPQTPSTPSQSYESPQAETSIPRTRSKPTSLSTHKQFRTYIVLPALVALAILFVIALSHRTQSPAVLAVERRVTANPPEAPISAAVLSADGRFVAYSDSSGVYIRHIDTGETRAFQLPRDFDAVPTSWAPDGMSLLMGVVDPPFALGSGRSEPPSLWRVPLIGGTPKKLISDATGGVTSPDGSKIAFLRGGPSTARQLWVMERDGSNPRKVVDSNEASSSGTVAQTTVVQKYSFVALSGIAWSPDGSHLAYIRRFVEPSPGPAEDNRSLETVDVNGGQPTVLKVTKRLLPAICWAPDGRLLFAYGDDSGNDRMDYGVWSVPLNLKSGSPAGKERQLTKGDGKIGGLTASANGRRLILWRDNRASAVFITELDSRTRRFSTPRRITLDENSNIVTSWTPDSRGIFLISNRSGTYHLFRQSIDQALPEMLIEGPSISQPRLSPDGTEILYLAGDHPDGPAQPGRLMALPLSGGPPRLILQRRDIGDLMCGRAPAKLCLLVNAESALTFDPHTGEVQPVSTLPWSDIANWSLAPDGLQLALQFRNKRHKIVFASLDGKIHREVQFEESQFQGMDWDAESKFLYAVGQRADGTTVVMRVHPDGSRNLLFEGERSNQLLWALPSPDGQFWALQEITGANNVWMVENF